MKTIEQVLGFVQGWLCAIRCDEKELNDDNYAYQALITIEQYIKDEEG